MTLARDLGMTRGELRRRMSCQEFTDWAGYYNWEAHEREKAEAKARSARKKR